MNNLAHISLDSYKISVNPESVSNRARVFCLVFSPSRVAHLARVQEQSSALRQSVSSERLLGALALSCEAPRHLMRKTPINQFLPVLAMSTLTTSDLEITSIRIETPVDDDQSFNTAVEVLMGEETQKRTTYLTQEGVFRL